MAIRTASIAAALACVAVIAGVQTGHAIEAEPISPGSFTIVILPDTQHYSLSYPSIFGEQTQWIADHKDTHNIQMVLHEGDVTHTKTAAEFAVARSAMGILDAAGVPYSIAPGNHDYTATTRATLFNDPIYFGAGSPYASQSSIGGFYEAGKTDNSYSTFTAGGKDWLVLSTEYGPRDQVVAWMNTVAAAHPNHNIILNTHAYLYSDGTRYDWEAKGTSQSWNPHDSSFDDLPGGVNDGEELWNKLVKNYENWKFTFNGHVLNDGTGWLASEGTHGNVVHQILANYQMMSPEGGNGYLRIMEFLADGDTVKVSTYSPHLSAYLEAPDQRFTLSMTTLPPEPEPLPPIHGVSCASVQVVDSGNVWSIVGTGPTAFSLISPANAADVSFAVGPMPLYRAEGVLMATVRQNSRGGNYGTVEVSQQNYFDLDETVLQVATSWAHVGAEHNVNVATAFFSFDDPWRAGHVEKNGTLRERANVSASNVSRTATGRYRLTLPGVNSQTDGMLFAIGGENQDNIIATAPTADGTAWEVGVRDNTSTTFGTFQDGRWSFVFVDYDAPGLVGGRVAANGSLLHAEGGFSLTHTAGSGAYRLHITDYTPSDGILLLTLAGLEMDGAVTAPANNIISYEASGADFLINTRDRADSTSPLQDAAFVFAFLSYDSALFPARLGDANMDGVVDSLDASLVAANWLQTGADWWKGDFNGDGTVDDLDLAVLAANWGAGPGGPAVPEPAAVALLVGAVVALPILRRRGR